MILNTRKEENSELTDLTQNITKLRFWKEGTLYKILVNNDKASDEKK